MHCYVFIYTAFIIIFNIYLCLSVEISSKIDFDSLESSKSIDNINKYNPSFTYENLENNKYKTKSIEISCGTSGDCNKADTSQSKNSDTIQTDVLVHIKTNIDLNNNKTNNIKDDTPDIPVVIGTLDKEHNQYLSNPSLSSTIIDKFKPKISSSLPQTTVTSLIYPHQVHLVSDPTFGNGYKQKSNYPTIQGQRNINIDSLILNNEKRTSINNKYNLNGVEYRIPHFEPTYHSHYFGENPPQQVIWYPKPNLNGYKTRNTVAKSTFWPISESIATTQNYMRSETTSKCKNKLTTGLEWYPTQRNYNVDPGSEINDKLGHLN